MHLLTTTYCTVQYIVHKVTIIIIIYYLPFFFRSELSGDYRD